MKALALTLIDATPLILFFLTSARQTEENGVPLRK